MKALLFILFLPLLSVGQTFRVEAEKFTSQSGTQNETTSDLGAGQNVGYFDKGDYVQYNISPLSAGQYILRFRVAAQSAATFSIGDKIIKIPATGSYQKWVTITDTLNLKAGAQVLKITANTYGFNLNWFEYEYIPQIVYLPATDSIISVFLSRRILQITFSNGKTDSVALPKLPLIPSRQ